jgi:hypothetical protein
MSAQHLIRLAVFMGGRIQSRSRVASWVVLRLFRTIGALRLGHQLTEGLKVPPSFIALLAVRRAAVSLCFCVSLAI